MKKVVMTFMVVALIGLMAATAMAGGAADTARERIKAAAEMEAQGEDRFVNMVPEAGYLYYIDLMSNAVQITSGGWISFLVVTNWDFNTRIRTITSFAPTGGTPSDIVNAEHYINPNDVVYLDENDLGFRQYGATNWFGIIFSDTNNFFSCGVLLYHTEFGMTWIPAVGPFSL